MHGMWYLCVDGLVVPQYPAQSGFKVLCCARQVQYCIMLA